MDKETKTKLKNKLEEYLGRSPTKQEEDNAQTDLLLLNKVLLEEQEEIKSRLDKLEK